MCQAHASVNLFKSKLSFFKWTTVKLSLNQQWQHKQKIDSNARGSQNKKEEPLYNNSKPIFPHIKPKATTMSRK